MSIENLPQRWQSDAADYPTLMLSLTLGLSKSIVYCIAFSVMFSYVFGYKYLIILYVYAIISTVIARKIAKPLLALNYKAQAAEASYRSNLTPFNFEVCIAMMLGLAKKTKRLQYFQTFYGQLGVVIPLLIIGYSYFTTAMTLGLLMQATSTLGTILDNLSYAINSMDTYNKLRASQSRLREIGIV